MKEKVLIVEDNINERDAVKMHLRDNYEIVEASDGQEALNIIGENHDIQIILLDLRLPVMTGTELLTRIHDREELRIIVLTGYSDEELNVIQAKKFNVFSYLNKPIRQHPLRFAIDHACKDIQIKRLKAEREKLQKEVKMHSQIHKKILSNELLDTTLTLIAKNLLESIEGYTCRIRLLDQNRGDYFLAASVPFLDVFDKRRKIDDYFSKKMVADRRIVVIDNLQKNAQFIELKEEYKKKGKMKSTLKTYFETAKSAAIIPIYTGILDHETGAIVEVDSSEKGFFSRPEQQDKIIDFANQAAVAIIKIWTAQQKEALLENSAQIRDMLKDISEELKAGAKLKNIFDIASKVISNIMKPEMLSVFLFNDKAEQLENMAEYIIGQKLEKVSEVYPPGKSITGTIYKKGETVLSNQAAEEKSYDKEYSKEYDQNIPSKRLQHYLGVPLKFGEKTTGVVRLVNRMSEYYDKVDILTDDRCLLDRGFSQDDATLLEIIAGHLAIAIQNADLFNQLNKKFEQFQTLHTVGQNIISVMDIERLLKLIVKEARKAMKAEICMLFLKKEKEKKITLRQVAGMPEIKGAFYNFGEGNTGQIMISGKPIFESQDDKTHIGKYDKEIKKALRDEYGSKADIESFAAVPIKVKNTILGVISVINKKEDDSRFNEDDFRLFQTLASQIGIAIENARIYDISNEKLAIAKRTAALGNFVRGVVHEINNTSGLISANIEALKNDIGFGTKRVIKKLALIEDCSRQAVEFAKELLGFSAIRDKEKSNYNINNLIDSAIDQIKPDLERIKNFNKIKIEKNYKVDEITCFIYEISFLQIVRNIILNAYQAMEGKGGVLTVLTDSDESEGYATIQFKDTGCGIEKKFIAKIFEPKFTTKEKGSGLGLWLVKMNLDEIGGSIYVKSEVQKGTGLTIKIPLKGK